MIALRMNRTSWLAASVAIACGIPAVSSVAQSGPSKSQGCPSDESGLTLPAGFCATIFADDLGHTRHMIVAPDGVLYVNSWSGRYFGNGPVHEGGFLIALQDTKRSGKADRIERFGATAATGGHGGTGIAFYDGRIYAEESDRIVRYQLAKGSIVPTGDVQVVVSGLPLTGDHPMHPFVIDGGGMLYVDVATATNSCQERNRTLKSPGIQPCSELETRGGIWRYDAAKLDQKFSAADRFATGIRNADGISVDSSGHNIYATQHGRDQLGTNWAEFYTPDQGAMLPAEELLQVKQGGDYGWPECYYDGIQNKLVLAPEYGGDGGKTQGVCAQKLAPAASFPAHWAPNDLLLYYGKGFPKHYEGGAFIAFHGSWNRAPFPQEGYNVVYQPLVDGKAAGNCEIFATGFAGGFMDPGKAKQRPTGLARAPDGALYVSDDVHGRIYRIEYRGGATDATAPTTPCPNPSEVGTIAGSGASPPEGTHPDAGRVATANLPVAPGATSAMVALGDRVYHGEEGGATCVGCHGSDGAGTPLGPSLKAHAWLWSDGSYAGIQKTIHDGVADPKQFRSAMPPMGGSQLTSDQVFAVSAYVWALSHAPSSR
jgi:glucose/arabinose dehydrogenase/mono/diheme cytochrome c family protein